MKDNLEEIFEKWNKIGFLPYVLTPHDQKVLSILLENTQYDQSISNEEPIFTKEQRARIVRQAWLDCKLKNVASVQPLLGPVGSAFYNFESTIQSAEVGARTQAEYTISIVDKDSIETDIDFYARSLATQMDRFIAARMKNTCNIENIIDLTSQYDQPLKPVYDYIACNENYVNILKERKAVEGIDLIVIPTMIDEDTFAPIALAGKYPTFFQAPIFMPYVLVYESFNTGKIYFRAGWFDGIPKEDLLDESEKEQI